MSGEGKNERQREQDFVFPLSLSKLRNDRLSLVPFDSDYDRFSNIFIQSFGTPEAAANFRYFRYGPFKTVEEFTAWYDQSTGLHRNRIWFAILVNAKEGTEQFAGVIGLMEANPVEAKVEVAHVNIVPAYQRSFVGSNANGILLHYLLDPVSEGGLSLRRVEWFANSSNERSINAAKRLGFHFEGTIRWHYVLPVGKEGLNAANNDGKGPGRHSASFSLCWDDWQNGAKEKVRAMMDR